MNQNSEINVGDRERMISGITGLGMLGLGLFRRSLPGALLGLLGGAMLYRGAKGHCNFYQWLGLNSAGESLDLERSLQISQPPSVIYNVWRHFENLPSFMHHLSAVTMLDERRSHWVAKAPLGQEIEWYAEITEDIPNQQISWRTIEGSEFHHSGNVLFRSVSTGAATELTVQMKFQTPGAGFLAKLLGEGPEEALCHDLLRFKEQMENPTESASRLPEDDLIAASPVSEDDFR